MFKATNDPAPHQLHASIAQKFIQNVFGHPLSGRVFAVGHGYYDADGCAYGRDALDFAYLNIQNLPVAQGYGRAAIFQLRYRAFQHIYAHIQPRWTKRVKTPALSPEPEARSPT